MPKMHRMIQLLPAAILILATYVPTANAVMLSLQPGNTSANVGENVALDLVVSGLGDFSAPSLGAFDVSVDYDNAALLFTGYRLGELLGDISLMEALDASGGDSGTAVNLAEVSLLPATDLDALQPGTFILATLTFDVFDLAVGAATELDIQAGAILGDTTGEALPITATSSAVIANPSVVPLPASPLLLALAALCGLVVRQRKRRQQCK